MKSTKEEQQQYMRRAIELSIESVKNGGGPFGAVIVKDGKIVAEASNNVTKNNDPTAHAEVCAIRMACDKLKTFNLEGAELYASCEPCPMCLSAMYWAHISHYFYANTKEDADSIGFSDHFIYKELALDPSKRTMPRQQILRNEAIKAFDNWMKKEDKTEY